MLLALRRVQTKVEKPLEPEEPPLFVGGKQLRQTLLPAPTRKKICKIRKNMANLKGTPLASTPLNLSWPSVEKLAVQWDWVELQGEPGPAGSGDPEVAAECDA